MAIEGIKSGAIANESISRNTGTQRLQNSENINIGSNNIQVTTQRAVVSRESNNQSYNGQENSQFSEDEHSIQEVSPEKIMDAIKTVNQKIKPTHTECQFSYHEDTKRISIKVIDQSSGDVIKEIPPEKTLDMIAKVWEMAGILVDEKR